MPRRSTRTVGLVALVVTALGAVVVAVPAAPTASAQPAPVTNPPIVDACGVDVTLVLDASGSISSAKAVDEVRGAAQAFLDALVDTNSTARVTQFATVSEQLAASTQVDDASLAPGGALADAVADYYDPRPPKPPGVDFWQYRGSGSPQSAGSFRSGSNTEYTNWDQALDQANDTVPELVVFVTDGDPTAYDFGQAGDPFPSPAVAYNTERGEAVRPTEDRAIEEADDLKVGGTRMLAVGVGAALNNPASVARLQSVSGPQVVRDLGTVTSLNQVDVALVEEFADLARFLRAVVLELCSPSLTVRKLAQTAGDADYLPASGWSITTAPAVSTGTYRWILPDDVPAPSKTVVTNANGFSQFQWEPSTATAVSTAAVSEVVLAGYAPGRPGPANDVRCELRDEDGDVRVVTSELSGTPPGFTLTGITREIVTCSVWNSFNYAPQIAITKTNVPTAVRGDLTPPATVTSNYVVTNPGNTPLGSVTVTDDKCAPVTPVLGPVGGRNVGDADGDGRLDPGEQWRYTCVRPVQVSRRASAQAIVNTATAAGTDPVGTRVEATDTADVAVFVPGIALTKLVDGVSSTIVEAGTEVEYTYAVTNTGNTPLGTVTLGDDTPPCTTPTRVDPPPEEAVVLGVSETWLYECGPVTPTTSVTNRATVTGVPLNPAGDQPFPDPNPVVTATDAASVEVVTPGLDLSKAADPDVVVLGPGGQGQDVTYTYEATNRGDTPLGRNGPSPPKAPGWITDDRCGPVEYVSGDDDGNDLIDPEETWVFDCTVTITAPTLNVATIIAQPWGADGPLPVDPLERQAVAFVDVVRPAIDVTKTALVPVVLDPGADPSGGPDVPIPPGPRPARYLYEVTNTGNVALELVPDPPVDDICDPLVFDETSDVDTDGLLDPDETWVYTCETQLDRDDGNTPPPGDESGLVTNTVTATGIPVVGSTRYPDRSVTDTDTAQVLVIEPGISMTKTASAPVVLLGSDVTYTFVVTNTGDVGLDVIGPLDDECTPITFVGGDTNGNGLLDGANSGARERWTYTCTRALGLPEPPATTDDNTATVAGIDPLGNRYLVQASASVRVIDPAIDLEKSVDLPLVPVGTTVTYSFEVGNAGQSPLAADDVLAQIVLTDESEPAVPSCDSPTYVSGDVNGDGLLTRDPPEVWLYECTAVATQPTTDEAVARGRAGTLLNPPLPVEVSASAAAFVQTFTPSIAVTKTAAPAQLSGPGEVTYTYVVTNTGDVPLAGVVSRIADDRCSPLTYVSGDEDADGLLDTPTSIFEDSLPETWTFTCRARVSTTTTNTVVATGTPVGSTGEPLCGIPGIPPCDVSARASATVTIGAATITITKRTTSATTRSFDFTFEPLPPAGTTTSSTTTSSTTTTTPGCDPSYPTTCIPSPPPDLDCDDVAASAFAVSGADPHGFDADDDGVGCEREERFALRRDESRSFPGLAAGRYLVTEVVPADWELERIQCVDATGDTVVGLGARRVEIFLGPGETVTCEFVNRSTGKLPDTGSSGLGSGLTIGATALGFGAVLLVISRRRRRGAAAASL